MSKSNRVDKKGEGFPGGGNVQTLRGRTGLAWLESGSLVCCIPACGAWESIWERRQRGQRQAVGFVFHFRIDTSNPAQVPALLLLGCFVLGKLFVPWLSPL